MPRRPKPRIPNKVPVQPPAVIDPSQRYSLPEVCAILRQSPAKTHRDLAEGKMVPRHDGKRTYVLGAELIRVSALTDEDDQDIATPRAAAASRLTA